MTLHRNAQHLNKLKGRVYDALGRISVGIKLTSNIPDINGRIEAVTDIIKIIDDEIELALERQSAVDEEPKQLLPYLIEGRVGAVDAKDTRIVLASCGEDAINKYRDYWGAKHVTVNSMIVEEPVL
jgi:hypothetical protein